MSQTETLAGISDATIGRPDRDITRIADAIFPQETEETAMGKMLAPEPVTHPVSTGLPLLPVGETPLTEREKAILKNWQGFADEVADLLNNPKLPSKRSVGRTEDLDTFSTNVSTQIDQRLRSASAQPVFEKGK